MSKRVQCCVFEQQQQANKPRGGGGGGGGMNTSALTLQEDDADAGADMSHGSTSTHFIVWSPGVSNSSNYTS